MIITVWISRDRLQIMSSSWDMMNTGTEARIPEVWQASAMYPDGLDRTLQEVPANKVVNALPFYTILWKTEGTDVTDEYITMSNEADFMNRAGVTAEWDEETCQNYAEWTFRKCHLSDLAGRCGIHRSEAEHDGYQEYWWCGGMETRLRNTGSLGTDQCLSAVGTE